MSFVTFYLLKNVIRYFQKWSQEFPPSLHTFIQTFIHRHVHTMYLHGLQALRCFYCSNTHNANMPCLCPPCCTGHNFNNLNVLYILQLLTHIRLEKAVFFCMPFCHHYPFSFCLSNFWNAETPSMWLAQEFFTLWKVYFVIVTVRGSLVVVLILLPPEESWSISAVMLVSDVAINVLWLVIICFSESFRIMVLNQGKDLGIEGTAADFQDI